MDKKEIWGQLGDLIFEGLWIPKGGSFTESRVARFREVEVLDDKNAKQPMGMELTTFNFSVEIPDYPFFFKKTSGAERMLRTSGVGNIGETVFGRVGDLDIFRGLMGDSLSFGQKIEKMQADLKAYAFVIGDVYKGMYTVNSVKKNYYFKPDGKVKMAIFEIQLEEDGEGGVN